MKRFLLAIAFVAVPVFADSRIKTLFYNPDRVVSIDGHRAVQTMIEFGADERIENIALGDSAAWQVTPNKRANLIFVKPLIPRARSNMTVVTDKRRYLFDLHNDERSRIIYSLRFVYPDEPKVELIDEPVAAKTSSPEVAPAPPALNTNWQSKGDSKLIPARVYDDGASTFIAWADTSELPAVLTMGADGSEGPVNFAIKGDYLIVEGVAPRYVLRLGKATAILTNLSPRAAHPVAPSPQSTMSESAK